MAELDKGRAVELLNRILEAELAGVVRYTHYSFLVFGHNRIPIVSWLRVTGDRPAPRQPSNRYRRGDARVARNRSQGARPLPRTAEMRRRAVGHHRGIRPADGLCRGASRE